MVDFCSGRIDCVIDCVDHGELPGDKSGDIKSGEEFEIGVIYGIEAVGTPLNFVISLVVCTKFCFAKKLKEKRLHLLNNEVVGTFFRNPNL